MALFSLAFVSSFEAWPPEFVQLALRELGS